MPEPATIADLKGLPNLTHDEQGWWEHWTHEDEPCKQLLGNDAAALRWLDFWRSVR